ncbi:hypothetical protein ACGGAQ_00120 [Micromonospora sp. NPDC047557]|uniref:hypothetical protein n=1 Tax=Micromonospora sp. NPDC047557 TaxID=3364250 RepID=UPI00371F64F2
MSRRPATTPTVRHRPSALLLALGLLLGLAVPLALPDRASARVPGDPLCTTSGWSVPPGINNPLAVTWSNIGSRSNAGYDYRYWMTQELSGSTAYYLTSFVAKCSGGLLISTTTLPPTNGAGTAACTSTADRYPTSSDAERYVGQITSWQRGYLSRLTFRFWHREWFSVATLRWNYGSSFVVRC